MRKHLISGLLALYLLLCLPLSAAAHAVPDESQDGHCSITITMTYKGKAVPGGTLALYKVGDVVEDDGNYSFVPVEAIQDIYSERISSRIISYYNIFLIFGDDIRIRIARSEG